MSRPNETIKRRINDESDGDMVSLSSEELEKLKEGENEDPIVTENTSNFTLTLEYIEIVLPDDEGEDGNLI